MPALATIRRQVRPTLPGLVALVCVLLILFVGVAQVVHIHAADEAANPGCSLCAVAHVAAVAAPMAVPPAFVVVVQRFASLERSIAPRQLLFFALYVRPPPAATAHA